MLLSEADARHPVKARAFLSREGDIASTPDAFKTALLGLSQLRSFEAGETIVNADDTDGAVFAIVCGAVAYIPALGPTDADIANILHAGQWFGYVPLIMDTPRNATLIARTTSVVAVMPRSSVDGLLAANPDWWRHIAVFGIQYGNVAANIAADLMIADSNRRCIATLLRLAGCRFRKSPIREPTAFVSQAELGAMANMSRNSVNRILQEMTTRGFINVGYLHIQLRDPEALRAIVDDS